MNTTQKALATLILGVIALAGCSSADNAAEGRLDVALVDTGSILFPIPLRDNQALDDAKVRFWMGEEVIDPVTAAIELSAAVYAGPGETYELLTFLLPGHEVTYDALVGHWARLVDNGGYVSLTEIYDAPWFITVAGKGEEAEVNECPGALVYFNRISEAIRRPYYVIHSFCGGEPLLRMNVGDTLLIDDALYTMDAIRVLDITGNATHVEDMPGDVLIHTDDIVHGESFVVALSEAQ